MIDAARAEDWLDTLENGSVTLLAIDPPYFEIVKEDWDHIFGSVDEYSRWLYKDILLRAFPKMAPNGSVLMFGALGKHGSRPLFKTMDLLEGDDSPYTYRNMVTWKKRRAYGKSHDYLFCREEIVWYSVSAERTQVVFNIPLLDVKRGYAGFNPDHPAKSEYKRVSNVWDDIPELMRPERPCQKPDTLLERIVSTHSNPGDLVVDCMAGHGTTERACDKLGRRFRGCEKIDVDAHAANERNALARKR